MLKFQGAVRAAMWQDVGFKVEIVEYRKPGDIGKVLVPADGGLTGQRMDFHGQEVGKAKDGHGVLVIDSARFRPGAEFGEGFRIHREKIDAEIRFRMPAMQCHGTCCYVCIPGPDQMPFHLLQGFYAANQVHIQGVAGVSVMVDGESTREDKPVHDRTEVI